MGNFRSRVTFQTTDMINYSSKDTYLLIRPGDATKLNQMAKTTYAPTACVLSPDSFLCFIHPKRAKSK